MSSGSNYVLLRKKSFFWFPLVMMGIVFYKAYGELLEYGFINNVSLLIWFFIGVNSVLLICSYLIMKRRVHKVCGILMIAISMLYLSFLDGYEISGLKDFWYLYLSVIAGLLLFIFSFFDYSDESDYSDDSE